MIPLQLAINGLLLGGLYLLMAQGMNLVFGVMRILNLAHGVIIVACGLVVFRLHEDYGLNPLVAILIVAPAAFVAGMLIQRLLIEQIRATGLQFELLSLMLTYGLAYILINAGIRIFGAEYLSVPYLQSSLDIGRITINESLLVSSIVAVLLSAALYVWLTFMSSGKRLRATSQSSIGAVSCGIDTRRVRMIAFGLGGALAAAAGALLIVVRPLVPQISGDFTVIAFVVVALGGLGDYVGAAVGAVLLGLVESYGGYYMGASWQAALPYIFLLLVMLVRPQGLQLGQRLRAGQA
jgi:branched-chain amino acid transport system permease protein